MRRLGLLHLDFRDCTQLDIPVQPIATIWFMSLFVHVLPLHVLEVC